MITNPLHPRLRYALEASKGRIFTLITSQRDRRRLSSGPNSSQAHHPTKIVNTLGKSQAQQAASTNDKFDTGSSGETQPNTLSNNKISWLRGYLGAHSNTDPPDAKFLGVAAIVLGAGYYAWFIEPPVRKEDS